MYSRREIKLVECPCCGTINNQDRETCRYCKSPLENSCSDDICECLNKREARYCKKCGKPTIFMTHKVFNEKYCAFMRQSAKAFFEVNGDPNSPEAKAKKEKRHRERMEILAHDGWLPEEYDDDVPELEHDDYIPYY